MSSGVFSILQLLKRFGATGGGNPAATALHAAAGRLNTITVEGSAGGGLVRVTATASRTIKAIEIDPTILSKKHVVEDLVRTAVNDAMGKAAEAEAKEQEAIVAKLTADLPAMLSQALGAVKGGGGGQLR
jgi:nucleoid-associated protein EbfC